VRACVIFNPAAKGQKAERFRRCLAAIATHCELKRTAAPGDARRLAATAIGEGHDTIIAAGGDGTLNEVLNGMGDVTDGFERARLGVLPLGTINVFARELGLPTNPDEAWPILQRGNERRIDLPRIESGASDNATRTYFAQLAGAGLDARAIQIVDWPLKKRIGPLAYVVAGLKAMTEEQAMLTIADGTRTTTGQLVLVGNGSRYGGSFRIFPDAEVTDGWLHVAVFPRVDWLTLIHCGLTLLSTRELPRRKVVRLRVKSFTLTSQPASRFEVDGELGDPLPARFTVQPAGLRVLVP
jgi:YegS/Rv2252/BmrU family lipid kinase